MAQVAKNQLTVPMWLFDAQARGEAVTAKAQRNNPSKASSKPKKGFSKAKDEKRTAEKTSR